MFFSLVKRLSGRFSYLESFQTTQIIKKIFANKNLLITFEETKNICIMKTIEINYANGKSIEVMVPRKKANQLSLIDCLVSGSYRVWRVEVVSGLDEFIKYVVKSANDKSSNGGNWYAHCNGYCLGAIVDYKSRETKTVEINTYFNYRKSE